MVKSLPPPSIVQANDLDTLFIGALVARRYGVPLVYDAQELYTGMHTLPGWYRALLTVQEAILIRFATRVIAVNGPIGEIMQRKYRRRIDSVVLNCPPYEPVGARCVGRTIREEFRLAKGIPIFLYSGGLSMDRGIENTILALHHVPRGVLVLLGEGDLKDALISLAKDEGLGDRVFFSDFLRHEEVPRFISSADVGVIPYENVGTNHYLASPSKLFHYIMAELPVACSDFPFLRSIVTANDLGAVFDPGSPASIASALRTIVDDPYRYGRHKENLFRVKRRYCWEEEEKRFLSVYQSLPTAHAS